MPRWESDPQGRLERAALELFEAQGFERTTVAQIARHAGLAERSFYRYFPDKREVLFARNELETHLVAALEATDGDLSPLAAVLHALGTADQVFRPRDFLLRRGEVIAANPALSERELIKLAEISDALARGLVQRGVDPGRARLVVEVAMSVLRRAVELWLTEPDAGLAELVARVGRELGEISRGSEVGAG